ncbi:hypothetical protein L9F63_006868, partial [Diploptera punctata]
ILLSGTLTLLLVIRRLPRQNFITDSIHRIYSEIYALQIFPSQYLHLYGVLMNNNDKLSGILLHSVALFCSMMHKTHWVTTYT